ncbi:GNAT family N-acetyltransferase [Streptomyces sp. AHU1]|uniref:GNAT family N-acetyltransferase n=1 Tax=Streptomyces sp. AHU1 TaxID=3377215 RepID=UPI0038782C55
MTSVTYDWRLTHDLDAFLALAGDFLRSRPAQHTVALTVTDGLHRRGMSRYGESAPVFGALERDGVVRAAFFRTPPYRLNLTPLDERGAQALAALLADAEVEVPGVSADTDTVEAFAGAWGRRTGARSVLFRGERLYRLGELSAPEPAPTGRPRVADEGDRDLLARWYAEFAGAIGEGAHRRDPGAWADDRISYGGITLWEDPEGTPVAMAGATPPVAGQLRIGPVYTPAHLRGRGYAGAVTAEVSRAAAASGVQEVLLFTDLANPTSNGLYRRIGYRPVSDFASYDFTYDG